MLRRKHERPSKNYMMRRRYSFWYSRIFVFMNLGMLGSRFFRFGQFFIR